MGAGNRGLTLPLPDGHPFHAALAAIERRLYEEFGDDLLGILVAGSAAAGTPDESSDLDLFVLIRQLRRQRRTRYVYGVEVELFINPPQRITAEIHNLEEATTHMFATGIVAFDPEGVVAGLCERAAATNSTGPEPLPADQRLVGRYYLEDLAKDARDVAADPPAAGIVITKAVEAAITLRYDQLGRRRGVKPKRLLADLEAADTAAGAVARCALDPAGSIAERLDSLEALIDLVTAPLGGRLVEWETPWQEVRPDGSLPDDA